MSTQADKRRFTLFREIGCVACWLEGIERDENRAGTPADVHHLIDGGRRRGHQATIPLCPWHHRGVADHSQYNALSVKGSWVQAFRNAYGPSYALDKRAFQDRYGSDDELLALANAMLAAVEALSV